MGSANIIAIDGPAGSGKTTVGMQLADCLGYLFFDTGVMYRAVTWAALDRSLDPAQEGDITRLAEGLDIDVCEATVDDGRGYDVCVDGQDATWEIRRSEVEAEVSRVSAYPGVRQALASAQRRIGLRGRVVMVGRDIGTVVLPEADLKIYLDASVEVRARRRYLELIERGEQADEQAILKAMRARDQYDSTRAVSPLRAAEDAIVIDSNDMTVEEVVERVRQMAGCCANGQK